MCSHSETAFLCALCGALPSHLPHPHSKNENQRTFLLSYVISCVAQSFDTSGKWVLFFSYKAGSKIARSIAVQGLLSLPILPTFVFPLKTHSSPVVSLSCLPRRGPEKWGGICGSKQCDPEREIHLPLPCPFPSPAELPSEQLKICHQSLVYHKTSKSAWKTTEKQYCIHTCICTPLSEEETLILKPSFICL